MSAPAQALLAPPTRARLRTIGRFVTAVAVGGVVAAVVFLIMVQGSMHKGYTTLDFNHVLGSMIQGTSSEVTTHRALGVVGDTAGPTGLYYSFLLGIGLLTFHGVVIAPLVRRHWVIQAIPLAIVVFLLVGLVYCPLADDRFPGTVGLFGVDAGDHGPLVLGLSSLGFALIGSRCFSLMTSPSWWRPRKVSMERALEESVGEIEPVPASLELAEDGPEQGRMGP